MSGIIYAQAFRECITTIRLKPNASGKKWSRPLKKSCGRRNFNIEETSRQTGRRQSKNNLRVRSLPFEHTIYKILTMEQEFRKPEKHGKKANEKQRKRRKTPEIFVEIVQKDEKRTIINDPNVQPQVPFVLFFRSLVQQLVQRCQENSDINLKPSHNENFLVLKSHGSSIIIVSGEEKTRSGPQYVHFNNYI